VVKKTCPWRRIKKINHQATKPQREEKGKKNIFFFVP
jgi:hypothetical protein